MDKILFIYFLTGLLLVLGHRIQLTDALPANPHEPFLISYVPESKEALPQENGEPSPQVILKLLPEDSVNRSGINLNSPPIPKLEGKKNIDEAMVPETPLSPGNEVVDEPLDMETDEESDGDMEWPSPQIEPMQAGEPDKRDKPDEGEDPMEEGEDMEKGEPMEFEGEQLDLEMDER
ncbi:hypothetical protein HMI55_004625 [Coelomomyces lativittatus]|nr:hypothetical protein HMI55_004625 [Coelomomyces lativittatus]KAJ1511163.1 hypothetical protein HMI56_005727 [Coelomomyces lativittatus]